MTRKSERELERELDRLGTTDGIAPDPTVVYENPETGVRRTADGDVVDDVTPLMVISGGRRPWEDA